MRRSDRSAFRSWSKTISRRSLSLLGGRRCWILWMSWKSRQSIQKPILRNCITRGKEKNMAFRVFLDANILLDFALKRPEYESARKLIEWVVEGRVEAYVTPSIIHV